MIVYALTVHCYMLFVAEHLTAELLSSHSEVAGAQAALSNLCKHHRSVDHLRSVEAPYGLLLLQHLRACLHQIQVARMTGLVTDF